MHLFFSVFSDFVILTTSCSIIIVQIEMQPNCYKPYYFYRDMHIFMIFLKYGWLIVFSMAMFSVPFLFHDSHQYFHIWPIYLNIAPGFDSNGDPCKLPAELIKMLTLPCLMTFVYKIICILKKKLLTHENNLHTD